MKRRDFIKAFSATAVSIPLVSALAKTNGADKVIETFQMSDIPKLDMTGQTDLVVREYNGGLQLKNTVVGSIMHLQNPEYLKPIFVLAPSYKRIKQFWVDYNLKEITSLSQIQYINHKNRLLGIRRGTKIIGLYDWWSCDGNKNGEIQESLYVRESIVVNYNQYFGINYESDNS